MKKFLKVVKHNILVFILGGIVFSAVVVIASTIPSSEVAYDTSASQSDYNTVQGALDNLYSGLYNVASAVGSGLSLIIHSPGGLSKELVAGLYRFQGETVDNYICFGTTVKSDCVNNTHNYMYRIIGINNNGQMKLLKKEPLDDTYKWNSNWNGNWSESDLNTNLNGSYFLTNTTYVPDSTWSNRIATTVWHHATFTNANVDAATIYNSEMSGPTLSTKIGLMYLSDFYYGLPGGNNCNNTETYNICKTSWYNLKNSFNTTDITPAEWTITNFSRDYSWYISSDGRSNINILNGSRYYVRPVFYLIATQVITSGTGTLTDPYILG